MKTASWVFAPALAAMFLAGFLSSNCAGAAEQPPATGVDLFFENVRPLLTAKCVACHGVEKQEGGLRLDSREALLKGGETGPAIAAGKPDASLLMQAVRHTPELAMPPKEKLPEKQLTALSQWIALGAPWPDPVRVLFEDEPELLAALVEGSGAPRLDEQDRASGKAAMVVPQQRLAPSIPGWNFKVRERPVPGEYRYLRFAWKKRGAGAILFEVASSGKWREQKQTNAAWIAGKNTTGWGAIDLADKAPGEWTVVTRDLWQDGQWGDFALTGLCLTAVDGGEALLDSVLLGPTLASLDAYKPGRGLASLSRPGRDAWSDPENPIVKIFKGQRLDLWSLKSVQRPEIPAATAGGWARTPVDRFIAARLEEKKLAPSAEADRRTLARRLYFDLLGLPPTPAEVRAFVEDKDPQAYEKLVDRLLDNPHYGVRWARQWLDVVRYSDTNGFERDEFRPPMWRYRDWVVSAFRNDLPYDQFVRQQLAGDELAAGRDDDQARAARVATGFLRLGPFDSTGTIFQEDKKGRDELLADLVNTTGAAFLATTLSCCQCHDHKYDPLSQADHFRMRAFFAAVKPANETLIDSPEARAEIDRHNQATEAEAAKFEAERGNLLAPLKDAITAKRRAGFAAEIQKLFETPEAQRDEAAKKKLQPFVEQLKVSDDDALKGNDTARKQYDALQTSIAAARGKKRTHNIALTMTDAGAQAPPTHVFFQGDFNAPREEVPPGVLSVFDPNPAVVKPGKETTGRRTALADWIVSPQNPLAARVLVNRVWQRHFGVGLVATPNDFGFSGARPSHPELLDWLASEFVAGGWSIKRLERLILTSAVYRQASLNDRSRHALDPENALYWRQNTRRLDAETLRDSLLAVSGQLLPDDSGPPRWPPLPSDLLDAQPGILEAKNGGDGGRMQGWYADPLQKTRVRSLFLIQKRSVPIPLLQSFDLPDTNVSCARRNVTTVAPQALALLNSSEALRAARALADEIAREAGDDRGRQIEVAVARTLVRSPSDSELKLLGELLERHTALHRAAPQDKKASPTEGDPLAGLSPEQRALVDLARLLVNLNEFVYVD